MDDFLTQEHSDETMDELYWDEVCELEEYDSDFFDRDVEYIYPFEADNY